MLVEPLNALTEHNVNILNGALHHVPCVLLAYNLNAMLLWPNALLEGESSKSNEAAPPPENTKHRHLLRPLCFKVNNSFE